jgi:hypothetical protein
MNARLHSKWNTSYNEISRLYASGKTIQDACIKAKIHPSTYYKICKSLNKESIAKEIITTQKGGTTNNSTNTINKTMNKESIAKEIIATQKGGTTNNSTNTINKTMIRDSLKKMYNDRINNGTENIKPSIEFNMDNYIDNKEPLSIDNKEPLSIENKKPLSIDNKEPLSIENKKPRKRTAKIAKAINKI